MRVRTKDGDEREFRQPHLRGGRHAPLDDDAIVAKFRDNAAFGGWSGEQIETARAALWDLFGADDLAAIAPLRG